MGTSFLEFFRYYFPKLSGGWDAYPWQEAMYNRLLESSDDDGWVDGTVEAPTGTGKTALMIVWLLAFGWSRMRPEHGSRVPRRLVWVVDNRVVVDQATDDAERLCKALSELPATDPLRVVVREASATRADVPALSTLRGQHQDNEEWKEDPTRPAILVGTVDLIGSNLLFRGYREGRYWRPSAGGILGVDTLLVNDEAHLTPAFHRLLQEVARRKPASKVPDKVFRALYLSATPPQGAGGSDFRLSFERDLEESETFRRIYRAPKQLAVHRTDHAAFEKSVMELATGEPHAPRTLVYINGPEQAAKLAAQLRERYGAERVGLLTGTMRGFERDQLTKSMVFQAFQAKEPPAEAIWLVCTAAGEVGVNITSELLVTQATTAERLQQRLGRLNRFGRSEPGRAFLVTGKLRTAQEEAAVAYFEDLREVEGLPGWKNVSCESLRAQRPPTGAVGKPPAFARFEDRLLDLWAQTTYTAALLRARGENGRKPIVPPVGPWLRGKEDGPPETEVAWRDDVTYVAKALRDERVKKEDVQEILQKKYRVLPQERLQEPSTRVKEKLARLPDEELGQEVLLMDSDGDIEVVTLSDLIADEHTEDRLAHGLLLLPSGVGGLDEGGMFRPDGPKEKVLWDVADETEREDAATRARVRITGDTITALGGWKGTMPEGPDRTELARWAAEAGLGQPKILDLSGEEKFEWLVYAPPAPKKKARIKKRVSLADHLNDVTDWAQRVCAAAGLSQEIAEYIAAARCHDSGKDCELWQKAMGNREKDPVAKSVGIAAPAMLGGFRHEFRSVLQATEAGELAKHLIATHHGYGRPFFEVRQYDRGGPRRSDGVATSYGLRRCEQEALEGVDRYARLQAQYGHWGLAYLEALFKGADALASEEEEQKKGATA